MAQRIERFVGDEHATRVELGCVIVVAIRQVAGGDVAGVEAHRGREPEQRITGRALGDMRGEVGALSASDSHDLAAVADDRELHVAAGLYEVRRHCGIGSFPLYGRATGKSPLPSGAPTEVASQPVACLLDLTVDRPGTLAGDRRNLAVAQSAEVKLEDPAAAFRELGDLGQHGVELRALADVGLASGAFQGGACVSAGSWPALVDGILAARLCPQAIHLVDLDDAQPPDDVLTLRLLAQELRPGERTGVLDGLARRASLPPRLAGGAARSGRTAAARRPSVRRPPRLALVPSWLPCLRRSPRAPRRPGGRVAPRLWGAAAKHGARAAEARSAATDPGAPAEGLPPRARPVSSGAAPEALERPARCQAEGAATAPRRRRSPDGAVPPSSAPFRRQAVGPSAGRSRSRPAPRRCPRARPGPVLLRSPVP